MFKKIIVLLLAAGTAINIFSVQDNTSDNVKKNNILFKTKLQNFKLARVFAQEVPEWTMVTAMTAMDFAFFHSSLLKPAERNFIPEAALNKSYTEENMPAWLGIIGIGLSESLLLFIPNNVGFLNLEAYINFKAYAESIVTVIFIVDMLKYIVGEKRPDYQARLKTGNADVIRDGRMSFPSDHTAVAFATSTYLTLFMFQYIGDNYRPDILSLKILGAVALNSIAGAIAALRVIDNKHYIHDVVAGGIIGSLVSLFFYSLHNFMGIYPKKDSSFSVGPASKGFGVEFTYRF